MLDIGVLLNKRYQIKGIISRHENTTLYRAFDRVLNIEVAVREIASASPDLRLDLLREMEMFAALRHPNLMRIIDHFEVSGQGLYQVTDFLDGRKVFNPTVFPDGMSVREVVPIVLSICDVLYYLHNNRPPIIHGDVNLNTIFYSPGSQGFLILPKWNLDPDTGARIIRLERERAVLDVQKDLYDLGLATLSFLTSKPFEELSSTVKAKKLDDLFETRSPTLPVEISQIIARVLHPDRNERFVNVEACKSALLNAVIFMPGESSQAQFSTRSTPIQFPLQGQSSTSSSEESEPKTPPETQPMSTTPIRRRVPWGLLTLGFTAGLILLFFMTTI